MATTTLNIMPGRRLLPTVETLLKKFVEEYLISNREMTFINVEEMTTAIQNKSYRFSRMKRQVFAQKVEQAYYSYCIERDISFENNQPTPVINDSDSDIEIQDPPPRATMNNQLQGLYKQNQQIENSSSPGSAQQVFSVGIGRGRFTAQELEQQRKTAEAQAKEHSRPSKLSVSSNDRPSSTIRKKHNSGGSESMLKDDDDDDLQIIQEFPAGVSSPSVPTLKKPTTENSGSVSKDTTVLDSQNQKPSNGCADAEGIRNIPPVIAENKPAKTNDAVESLDATTIKPRGTKRKAGAVSSSGQSGSNKRMQDALGKSRKREVLIQTSNYTFKDFGGSEKLLEEICKLLMHLKHPEMYRTLGVTPPRGFLLHGPPGVGKTLLAQAIAGELKLPILKMAATELISGISGESESNIRDVFDQALSVAPCIIFMDEIDAITPKRENASKEMERRIVAQLLACIDDLVTKPKGDQVLLIGATSRIEAIDCALRRAGRFDREICLGIPNENAREKILRVISDNLKLEPNFDFKLLAKLTPGFVGADLQALVREAAVQAVTEILNAKAVSDPYASTSGTKSGQSTDMEVDGSNVITIDSSGPTVIAPANIVDSTDQHKWITDTTPLSSEELANFCITMKDFEKAHKNVQPSAKREGFATVPDTTWDDIGALAEIRDELQVSILGPVKYSAAFEALGLNAPAGVLLCGPPGCGKTLLAKAVANEAGINFISVKGPELLNMYVGESERAVRQCFQRAKNSAPCVIFFDELDSLCPRRTDGNESGYSSRIVNQLLTEMDGMESRLGVFVMGATNRPDIIDPAILRPGRLDKVLFVNLPTPNERVEILKAVTKNGTVPKFADEVKIDDIAFNDKCNNYTGADLASLVREAGIAAFREFLGGNSKTDNLVSDMDLKLYHRHFEQAFSKTKPSVSQKDRVKYEKMKEVHSVITEPKIKVEKD